MHKSPIIRDIQAKSILSKSGIPGADYCINAYVGCSHACVYCYATFMKKYTGHTETWGTFVDVKVNAAELLRKQLRKAVRGHVMVSSVTDAYQPIEVKYRLTRQCLEILLEHQFPVGILTKSPLVLRDLDIIKRFGEIEVGLTISTDDEVFLDLSRARPGEMVYPVDKEGVKLPFAISVTNIDPPSVRVKLEEISVKTVPVQPQLLGSPEEGAVLLVSVEPKAVVIRGLKSELGKIEMIRTKPFDISRISGNTTEELDLDTSGTNVMPDMSRVKVKVKITPAEKKR